MIRINLASGAPRPKKGRGGAAASGGPQANPVMLVAIAVFALTAFGNGFWYWKLNKDQAKLNQDLATATTRMTQLSQVKATYEMKEKQRANFQRRVDLIEQLKKNQAGPMELLSMLGNTVNDTEQVWLVSMKDEGANISLDGMALSQDAVAKLIENLKRTGYFRNVEIKESFQDDTFKEMQAFSFSLICEKQTKSAS